MKTRLFIAFALLFLTVATHASRFVKASDQNISFTGRVLHNNDGSVSFDWTGVYMQVAFTGRQVSVHISESDTAYYNIFIDGRWKRKIKSSGRDSHEVLLGEQLRSGRHTVCLQRCTEGQYSRTTIFGISVDDKASLEKVQPKKRFIEVYGDSYTCGFGVETNRAEDPFRLETENCNDAYACLIARYFNADYALVAHSGKGLVRNYAQEQQTKENLLTRHDRLFDDHDTIAYDFKAYKPDLVMVNLGTNDYSPGVIPTVQQYVGNYLKLLRSLQNHYGDVPVLCITPHSASEYLLAALQVLRDSVAGMAHVHMAQPMPGIIHYGHDLGASWHPNRQGQRKIAMTLIPQVSAITKWEVGSMDALLNYKGDRDWAQIARYNADNERQRAIADPERVVFLGNSITDFWPRRHAEFWKNHPHFVCRGISGQTSSQFVTRFREDVINLKPKTVVINAGTNDIAENTGMYDEDVTFGNIVTMVELAQLHGIRVILSSVLPAKRFSWRPAIEPEEKIAHLNARIRKYAKEHQIPYADYYSALVSPKDRSLKEGHSVDGVHPNAQGYAVMEKVILPLLKGFTACSTKSETIVYSLQITDYEDIRTF